ncbi:MAG: CDP-diacylglycerol--glycerol-3-phosphate 3-phosphatidyltransferase [Gaiellales bacterium]|nr:CDP-diacylglycerol--glycerol-3-phosphate 3-phosphatidyltransferase [Gaiellales bacterium]
MNLPNSLTLFRILLIPVFMILLLGAVPYGKALAVAVFVLAAATDSLDGWFARRRRQVTTLGVFLDPLADKLLICAALLALIELDELSAWVAMVILAREFAVTGLRMVAAARNLIIPASPWGKVKTASQMLAIVVLILKPGCVVHGVRVSDMLLGLAVLLTLGSGVDYFVRAWDRLRPPEAGGGS